MNKVWNTLKELSETIDPNIVKHLSYAIKAAEDAGENRVIEPLTNLIILLSKQNDVKASIGNYMRNPETSMSVTRRFFYTYTSFKDLMPEDPLPR